MSTWSTEVVLGVSTTDTPADYYLSDSRCTQFAYSEHGVDIADDTVVKDRECDRGACTKEFFEPSVLH